MKQEKITIHAYSDMFVKYLFGSKGNEDLLLSFINATLKDSGFSAISEVIVVNPFNVKEFFFDKESVLDVKASDEKKRWYDVEVQVAGKKDFVHRSLYYWSKMYGAQICEGDSYTDLVPCIAINVLNFFLFPDRQKYHTCFILKDIDDADLVLTDYEVLHFLELQKLKNEYPVDKLGKWMYFFKYGGIMSEVMKQIIEEDADIAKAHRKLREFTEDEKLRDLALRREIWRLDHETDKRRARMDGVEEGIEQGKILDKQDVLIRLLTIRFGSNKTAEEVIRSVTDVNLLDAALDEVLSAVSLEDVLKVLQVS